MTNEDEKQLDLMWNFLQAGMVKSNVEVLKEYCEMLKRAMMQKTAGQAPYAKRGDVDWKDLGTIINTIVVEAMCLYLSGDLDGPVTVVEEPEAPADVYRNPEFIEKKSKRINVLMTPSMFSRLKAVSNDKEWSVNEIINAAVEDWLYAQGK